METRTHRDVRERVPELEELHLPERPDGPGAAAMVAAGVGLFALGLLTVLAEASGAVHDVLARLDFGLGVGPLAGKTTLAVAAWILAWVVLGIAWGGRDVNLKAAFVVGLTLGVLGALGTFPPVFLSFAAE